WAAIVTAERLADGAATEEEVQRAAERATEAAERDFTYSWGDYQAAIRSLAADIHAHPWVGGILVQVVHDEALPISPEQVPVCQSQLLHDIFRNPFRPVTLNPAWRTSNVTALAQSIYDDRAFDRLPILADALEDAGCDNADILNHCRQPGEHVRECWVMDLVLGKE